MHFRTRIVRCPLSSILQWRSGIVESLSGSTKELYRTLFHLSSFIQFNTQKINTHVAVINSIQKSFFGGMAIGEVDFVAGFLPASSNNVSAS